MPRLRRGRRRGAAPLARRSAGSPCCTAPACVALGDAAVVVAVSAPHRAEAFEAARFAIDELKATVPDLEARGLGRRRELGPRGAAPRRRRRSRRVR